VGGEEPAEAVEDDAGDQEPGAVEGIAGDRDVDRLSVQSVSL
jgi:hypothetical protein